MLLDPPTVEFTDGAQVLGSWRGHTLAIWEGTPTRTAAEVAARVIRRNVRARPRGSAYVAVLGPSLELPDAEFRQVFIRLEVELRDELQCTAAIIEGKGFAASALRAVTTGIGLAARHRTPLRCFTTVEEAALWVAAKLQGSGANLGSPAELRRAFTLLGDRGMLGMRERA